MTSKPFSARNFLHILTAWMVLSPVMLACGVSDHAPTAQAQEPQPTPSLSMVAIPSMPELRRLTLEYPAQIRMGDFDVISLTLEMDDGGSVRPTMQFEGNVVAGDVAVVQNLYETHNVIAEAKLDILGLQVSPPGLISQTLSIGQSVHFTWHVRPSDPGRYRGTIWFYLRFVDKASREERRRAVSAQIVEIEAVNFLGLPAGLARTAGGLGSILGILIAFPFFEEVVKRIRGRTRRSDVHK